MEGGTVGHNRERDIPKDHPCQVCIIGIIRLKEKFHKKLGIYVKLLISM
jgi:hypothetical protein